MNTIIYFLVFLKLTQLLQRLTLMQEGYHFLFANLRVKHCKDSPVLSKWTFHRQKQPSSFKKYLSSVSNFFYFQNLNPNRNVYVCNTRSYCSEFLKKSLHSFVKNRQLVNDGIYNMKRKEGRTDHKYSWFILLGLKIKQSFISLEYQVILLIVTRKNL